MIKFIGACGFESSMKKERKNHDARVIEYNGKVISVRCLQASEKTSGGLIVWIWSQEGDKLESDYKMMGIAPCCSDLPVLVREAKKFIDSL